MKTIKFSAYRTLEINDEIDVEDDASEEDIQEHFSEYMATHKNADFNTVVDETIETTDGKTIIII